MSLELIRETVMINHVIGEDSAQTVIENDIIVPDVKPDISRILLLDGDTYVNSADAAQDKITVNGTIHYKILYVSDEESRNIKSINTASNFTYTLDVANARAGARCNVKCDIEHIEYNILNGRKINVRTIMKINGKAMEESEQSAVSNISSVDDVQILRDSTRINCYLGDNAVDYTVRETMEVPAGKPTIKEILRTDVKIVGKDYKIADNKVIAKGELNISSLYTADDEDKSIQVMEFEVPFTQFIELPDITDGADCEVDYRIVDTQFEPAEDNDGEFRILNGEIAINLYAAAYEKRSIEVVSDAYSPSVRLNIEKEPFKTEDVVTRSRAQVVIKDTITIGDQSPEIVEVFNVLSKPAVSEYRISDDKVIIEGVVNNNVLYLANNSEQPIFCHEQEIPFHHTIDIKGVRSDMDCDVGLDIEHCSYSMVSANEVEIRLVVGLDTKVVRQVALPLTVRVTELPLDERVLDSQPSIIVYFSKPGDTLWKIAKKYYTTVDYIQGVNNVTDQDLLTPGRQIIIPKRVK